MSKVRILKLHYSDGSLSRRSVIPKVRYNPKMKYGSLIRKSSRVRYSEKEIRFVNPQNII